MASERQIAANRRNAQASKGPKSPSGKKRSSKNAYRHGLSVPMLVRSEAQLKDLARQFAGDVSNAEVLELAERAADAHLELARIGEVRTAMIERAPRLNASGAGPRHPEFQELRHRVAQIRRKATREGTVPGPKLPDPFTPLPGGNEEEEQRFIDAARHALSELTKTCSYEKRAVGRRDRAIRQIVSIKTANNKNRGSSS
jgi:hypothetical protein